LLALPVWRFGSREGVLRGKVDYSPDLQRLLALVAIHFDVIARLG
jgi:hypothetical protein